LRIVRVGGHRRRAFSARVVTGGVNIVPIFAFLAAGAVIAPAFGMNPKTKELQGRTHRFFVRVSALCDALPPTITAKNIAEQLIDSAGGTDSNYRAACRGRTKKEFIAKLGVAAEEADESLGWLRGLVAPGLATSRRRRVCSRKKRTSSCRSL
jgi:four helix bundle protein